MANTTIQARRSKFCFAPLACGFGMPCLPQSEKLKVIDQKCRVNHQNPTCKINRQYHLREQRAGYGPDNTSHWLPKRHHQDNRNTRYEYISAAFETAVELAPEVLDCLALSGEQDYQLRVIVPDIDSYQAFLARTLLHLPFVAAVNSSFVLKQVKQTTALPVA